MKCDTHNDYKFTDDFFQFFSHLKNFKEYMKVIHQTKKHQQQILLYSNNRRFINTEDFNIIMSAKNYYNIIQKKYLIN
jgi:hypothetical protein